MENFKVKLLPGKAFKVLLSITILLSCLNLFSIVSRFFLHRDFNELIWLFDVSGDRNIPTWYASFSLLTCSLLILMIGLVHLHRQDRYTRHWIILSAIFLFLSIDEVAAIHERTTNLINVPKLGGFLYYDWVVFGIIFVAIVGISYRRFLRDLPQDTKYLFLLAALLFVGGAIGVEMINARIGYLSEAETVSYALMTAVEELFEMVGVATFVYALLRYLKRLLASDTIEIRWK